MKGWLVVCAVTCNFRDCCPSVIFLAEKSLSPREFDEVTVDTNSLSLEGDVKQHYRRSFAGMNSDETKACLTMTDSSFDPPFWAKQIPDWGFFSHSGLMVGEDLMTRSMVSLSMMASRGRRRTDITPTLVSHRDLSLRSSSPGNQTKRAVSMSRLDLLSQPRRRTIDSSAAAAASNGNTSMSKSMFNLPNNSRHVRRGVGRNGDVGNGMSRSMVHLAGTPPVPPPRSPTRTKRHLTVPLSPSSKQLSKSMVHLTPPPRPNRATQLRALAAARKEGQAAPPVSVFGPTGVHGSLAATGTTKEISHSPSRPRSSMSLASEKSATSSHQSTISMRVRSAPRRPRPVSIAGTVPDNSTPPQPPPRQSRTSERKGFEPSPVSTPPVRPSRAKSAGHASESESKPQNKPPPVPKPAAKAVGDKEEVVDTIQQSQAEESATDDQQQRGSPTNKPRINSEEAAKAALAEKRKLAREQAEREAELERQKQEQLRREEEEKRRQEEEEQRRMEEEHSRLVETLRLQEEEKLRKAIEEQQKLEEEQRLQREEEARQKAEREEQEKKAKEEAEKQRKELEEKLIKEEAERAERKKRVEQIMKRTRGKTTNQNGNDMQENNTKGEANVEGEKNAIIEESAMEVIKVNGQLENPAAELLTESAPLSESVLPPPDLYSSAETVHSKNDHNALLDSAPLVQPSLGSVIVEPVTKVELGSNPFENLTMSQTNGYGGEEIHFKQNVNSDEISPLVGNLLDFDPLSSNSNEKMSTSPDFNGLVDFSSAANTTTNQNENFLNNTDDLNSNRMAANPFISFEENANIKQETTVADLLS